MQYACAILSSVAWPALHYLTNCTIFEKKNIYMGHKMCVLTSSTNFVTNISHSKKNSARFDQNFLVVFMYHYPILIKLEFFRQFLEKF
jgi:hypothetical protein